MPLKLLFILTLGTLYHVWGFSLNEVLKVADSFAYLQMSYFLKLFSPEGLGSGWFGFLYSVPISIVDAFVGNDFFSAKIVNILLFNISAIILWKISRHMLSEKWSLLVIILFFLSPTLLHFNIHVLSENMYIPLFLFLVYQLLSYIKFPNIKQTILIAILLGCMYLTRAEAFIYLGAIGIIVGLMLLQKRITVKQFFAYGCIFLVSFFVFISPYLIHLHNITGEWGLTNKGASNLRQAELRGQERMDDAGFEQAVAELTDDKHHLIAGFAGGMKYDTPQIEGNITSYITDNPEQFFQRFLTNQKKLFTKNLPEIFLGTSPKLYFSEDSRFGGNMLLLVVLIFPLFVLVYGVYQTAKKQRDLLYLVLAFFIPACLFFTLFFTLNRYFLIFLPLLLLMFVFGLQELGKQKNIMGSGLVGVLLVCNILGTFLLSNFVYVNTEKNKDEYYTLKKEAGTWMKENNVTTVHSNILERFPIVTYYSGSKNRWITPYERETKNILTYAEYNEIDFLIVDTMDFQTYRPFLSEYLLETPQGMKKLKEFTNSDEQKVILYQFIK